ncbi:MAG: amidohydrolase family protein [Mogibacterium sp.]|nr:amidohydrolase family protein [Mogibacterium sp.]
MVVLKNARILPELTEGFDGDRADIVIENGLIQEIKAPGTVAAADAYDMTGKTVIPGLIEAHLHLDLCGMNTFEENVQPDAYRVMRAVKLAQDNLRMGYTTVRDVGDRNNIIISVARAFDEGMVMGPTVLASGKIISPTEAGNEFFGDMYLEADSPDEYRKAVRTQYQVGAKWIKIMGTGAMMNPGATPGVPIIMEDELKAACDTAKFVNRPVAVHCHGTDGIKMCIRCGVRTIEHSSIMDDECIRMYKAQDQTFMIPTLSAPFSFIEMPELVPEFMTKQATKVVKILSEGMIAAYEAGVKMGWGTDAGVYEGSHGNGIYEFQIRVNKLGMKPIDTLLLATKYNSEILYIDDKVGTIKEGKVADLVAYDGAPDQDIEVLNTVACVFKKGRLVTV